jgi:hypothetical protein
MAAHASTRTPQLYDPSGSAHTRSFAPSPILEPHASTADDDVDRLGCQLVNGKCARGCCDGDPTRAGTCGDEVGTSDIGVEMPVSNKNRRVNAVI